MKETILKLLPQAYPWRQQLLCYDSIDSTNTQAKLLAAQGAAQGTALIARQQTAGRGRMGRSFHSPENGGVYLSLILRPQCPAQSLMHLTCAVAVAMCQAVESASGLRPGIKWINDLVVGKRKLGGILTELSLRPDGTVDYAVVGIGINCCQQAGEFPPELPHATSLAMETGKEIDPCVLAAAMLQALQAMEETLLSRQAAIMATYRRDCVTLGQAVAVHSPAGIRHGTALALDDQGGLTVAFHDGTTQCVSAGEVSIRGMYGYIS